jgi:hypothetical protein
MKKDYYLIIDTETTINDKVADFGAVICDRKGNIADQCAVLVSGVFGIDPLFYIANEKEKSLWSKQGKDRRFTKYNEMLENGTRMLASVNAINNWLERTKREYNPILTAYNLPFDMDKCNKTGIDLTMFKNSFCMWRAAFNKYAMTKSYKNFTMQIHAINPPTKLGNCSFQTNAEVMARFILDEPDLQDEPHLALEDVVGYELPILKRLIQTTKKSVFMDPELGFDWRKVQLKNHFKAI